MLNAVSHLCTLITACLFLPSRRDFCEFRVELLNCDVHSVAPQQLKPVAVTFLYISVIGFMSKKPGQCCQYSAGLPM